MGFLIHMAGLRMSACPSLAGGVGNELVGYRGRNRDEIGVANSGSLPKFPANQYTDMQG